MLARSAARARPEADYRALAASSFLGLGSVWAQGLCGLRRAAECATKGTQVASEKVRETIAHGGLVKDGIIPLTDTIFLWQSLVCVAVEIGVVVLVVWLYTPPLSRARTAAQMGVDLEERAEPEAAQTKTPGEWLEHTPILTLLIVALGGAFLVTTLARAAISAADAGAALKAVNLDVINLLFLMLGFLLHWTPHRLMRAVRSAVPATWGIVLQFPFYFGIEGMITESSLSRQMSEAFVSVSSKATFPPLVAVYSAALGVFVPSGGTKWLIEAPYVMAAAHEQRVHLGWMVAVYDLGEALANLVQPFWMLPTLAVLGLRARDVMGFTFIVFLVLAPVVLVLVTLLGMTLPYPL